LETYPYGPGLRVDVLEPPTEGDGGGRGRYPAGDRVPERSHAFSHADVVPAGSDNYVGQRGWPWSSVSYDWDVNLDRNTSYCPSGRCTSVAPSCHVPFSTYHWLLAGSPWFWWTLCTPSPAANGSPKTTTRPPVTRI